MKREILDTLPASAIKELTELNRFIREVADENIAIITQTKTSDESTICQFRENISDYVFVIRNFKFNLTTAKISYELYVRPTNTENVTGSSIVIEYDSIKVFFNNWISNCNAMNKLKFEYLNPDASFYDEQFFEFFTNEDADATTNPFDEKRQGLIYQLLNLIEDRVKEDQDIDTNSKKEIIEEITELKNDLPKNTKKRIVSRFSKLAQKIKMTSNKVFELAFDVAKKELMKKILYEGVEQLPHAVAKIEHLINLIS